MAFVDSKELAAEIEAYQQARQSEPNAKPSERLGEMLLRMAKGVASRQQWKSHDTADLVSYAMPTLIDACTKFVPSRGGAYGLMFKSAHFAFCKFARGQQRYNDRITRYRSTRLQGAVWLPPDTHMPAKPNRVPPSAEPAATAYRSTTTPEARPRAAGGHDEQICRKLRCKRIPRRCPSCGHVGYTYKALEPRKAGWFLWCYMCALRVDKPPQPPPRQQVGPVSSPDPYAILRVSRGATAKEIKWAFRSLARECHPDMNPGDLEAFRFRNLVEAKEALLSAEGRP
jgi:hypothetical protein